MNNSLMDYILGLKYILESQYVLFKTYFTDTA